MRLYERDESIRSSWDDMQRDLRCCGGVNYENGFQEWESVLQAGRKYGYQAEVVCLEADEFAETPEVKTAIHPNAMQDIVVINSEVFIHTAIILLSIFRARV